MREKIPNFNIRDRNMQIDDRESGLCRHMSRGLYVRNPGENQEISYILPVMRDIPPSGALSMVVQSLNL